MGYVYCHYKSADGFFGVTLTDPDGTTHNQMWTVDCCDEVDEEDYDYYAKGGT